MTKSELINKIELLTKETKSIIMRNWGGYRPKQDRDRIKHLKNKIEIYEKILEYKGVL